MYAIHILHDLCDDLVARPFLEDAPMHGKMTYMSDTLFESATRFKD
jgi:hypothetical protein